MLMKGGRPKTLVIKLNLIFLAIFLAIYISLLIQPPSIYKPWKRRMISTKKPYFAMEKRAKIAAVNMGKEEMEEWREQGEVIPIEFQEVSRSMEWKDLFPEWIDEEAMVGPMCPEIPMPELRRYPAGVDLVVGNIPCNGSRDVVRLQVHLVVALVAAKLGKEKSGRVELVVRSECPLMPEIFRCDDLDAHDGAWWYFRPQLRRLAQKVGLPVGSCNLALHVWEEGKKDHAQEWKNKREAYATVLHSSKSYLCGAITLAQSLIRTGTKRDLVILVDNTTSSSQQALISAGWKVRRIERIRNPRAKNNSYNEYNYSKFRLWQLTDYNKVVFIDSDIIALRNLDILFSFPQMSATGNAGSIFNSGIMVIEPSQCTFRLLMELRYQIRSSNGGDQGFLNEVFVWWHRLPRRVNFLKNFWSNSTAESGLKNQLFGSDPPKLYSIHFLGVKPWRCYRDYDCNWDVKDQRVYASDVAHSRWWRVHDAMDEKLRRLCRLSERRRFELEWNRKKARQAGFPGDHWRINISDPRRLV